MATIAKQDPSPRPQVASTAPSDRDDQSQSNDRHHFSFQNPTPKPSPKKFLGTLDYFSRKPSGYQELIPWSGLESCGFDPDAEDIQSLDPNGSPVSQPVTQPTTPSAVSPTTQSPAQPVTEPVPRPVSGNALVAFFRRNNTRKLQAAATASADAAAADAAASEEAVSKAEAAAIEAAAAGALKRQREMASLLDFVRWQIFNPEENNPERAIEAIERLRDLNLPYVDAHQLMTDAQAKTAVHQKEYLGYQEKMGRRVSPRELREVGFVPRPEDTNLGDFTRHVGVMLDELWKQTSEYGVFSPLAIGVEQGMILYMGVQVKCGVGNSLERVYAELQWTIERKCRFQTGSAALAKGIHEHDERMTRTRQVAAKDVEESA